jgi:iron complex outermembrane receptor protein
MTPDKNFSIGGQYTRQTDNGGQLLMRADYAFKDSYYTRVENISETKEDNYRVVNASVRYISPNGRWELGLWGRNLTDELYYKARRIFESLGTTFGTPVRPRSVYASFQYNFGD